MEAKHADSAEREKPVMYAVMAPRPCDALGGALRATFDAKEIMPREWLGLVERLGRLD